MVAPPPEMSNENDLSVPVAGRLADGPYDGLGAFGLSDPDHR